MDEDNRICVHTEFTILPGKVDEFKEIFQELLGKLLKVSKITNATVLGELNPVAREALSVIGAENFRYWNGRPRRREKK